LASTLAVGGAIPSLENTALAQIKPDSTLGSESSSVTPNALIKGLSSDRIDGGARRGANLFHSFQEFNIEEGRGAYFMNPAGIENILSRVTGKNRSDILGTLGVLGKANLFLINPNGIIFGPNASLDVNGSFVGTTANGIRLANGDSFRTNSGEPLPTRLLNVNPNTFLFNQLATQPIINRSIAAGTGLQVPQGQSLLLIGGDVRLEGGQISALGGRVELGGLASRGSIELSTNGSQRSLSFPSDVTRADAYLSNSGSNTALVNVAASDSGSISVTARNIDILNGGELRGGLETGLGFSGAQAGDISLSAQGVINIANGFIFNDVRTRAIGNGGNINITTGSLSVIESAGITASTYGRGNAGDVTINARDRVSFDGEQGTTLANESPLQDGEIITLENLGSIDNPNFKFLDGRTGDGTVGLAPGTDDPYTGTRWRVDESNFISSRVETGAKGDGGNINITTGSLSIENGASLNTGTFGQGNAGRVNIEARDTVSFDGGSTVFSQVDPGAVGNGGDINITAGSLSISDSAVLRTSTLEQGNAGSINISAGSLAVTNGAQLQASTHGKGNAGSVIINAHNQVSFDGRHSAAYSTVEVGALGTSGGINITAGSLAVTDGAILVASTSGQGDAGDVNLNARDTVWFDGKDKTGFPSAASSGVSSDQAEGNSGNINITAGTLSMTNGTQLYSNTLGKGDAGNVNINVRDTVWFDRRSRALSTVGYRAVGKGGDININVTAGSLSLTNGATLNATTFGRGNAGRVNIETSDRVSLDGRSTALSQVTPEARGNSGDINIETGSLALTNGGGLTASSRGNGTAGNIDVDAGSIRLDNQAFLSSDTIAGQGDINLRSQDLILRRGSNITTNATGTATGGNITIETGVLAALENSDISANALEGPGGRVIIDAKGIFGTQFREAETSESDITATSERGPQFSGTVELNTPDVDLSSGLVPLPAAPVETEVVQACTPGGTGAESEFVVTGRGGLPTNPTQVLSRDAIEVDWVTLTPRKGDGSTPAISASPTAPESTSVVEAQGWVVNQDGEVVLTASANSAQPRSAGPSSAECHTPQLAPRG